MNAAALKAKIEHAQQQLSIAESEMERALQHVDHAPRQEKSIISNALSTALDVLKAARQDLLALEHVTATDGEEGAA
jgi:hypothetical protein